MNGTVSWQENFPLGSALRNGAAFKGPTAPEHVRDKQDTEVRNSGGRTPETKGEAVDPKARRTMATLKEGLSLLNAEGLVAKAVHVHDQLSAHAAQFPTPSPTLAALETAKEELLLTASAGAIDGGRSAHQAKRDPFRKLKDMLKQEADYVANVAKGDAQLILDGGYEVRAERKPSHLPVAPASLEALTPDVTNAVKIEWKGERTVRLYQVQMSTTDPAGTPVWNRWL
ncbi:MAG: hypothetical protein IPH53_00980 [Flavobacteriales bacterium]|nr:hypothetical protein [Flavobacteriales bacterium]